MSNEPSVFQAAIYADVATGTKHTVVCARAGSGKTTTIMGALASVPEGKTIVLLAFNKSIAIELGSRVPKGRGVEVKTLHAHGFAACRRAFRDTVVDNDKSAKLCIELFGAVDPESPLPFSYASVADLVSKAKDTLVPRGDLDALDRLIDAFGINCPDSDEDRLTFVRAAAAVLIRSYEATHMVDFSDMCWLPVVRNLRVWSYDRVFVDETQDLSPSQIELLLMCVRADGRICAVGDDRQAIYGFRGAGTDTIPRLIKRLDATVLPLSVSYRCCVSVVELAQTEVADFTAAPNAINGEVVELTAGKMLAGASAGDMIISRSNAPLLGYCLAFVSAGKRASIKGRDVGKGLIALIERSKARGVAGLLTWVDAWHKKETKRLTKRKLSTVDLDDRVKCINILTRNTRSIGDVIGRIESLFSDTNDSSDRITLGTTHKLKGLEAERVWMLNDTYFRRTQGGEEANCWYVAVTRAKESLFLVNRPREKDLEES